MNKELSLRLCFDLISTLKVSIFLKLTLKGCKQKGAFGKSENLKMMGKFLGYINEENRHISALGPQLKSCNSKLL